MLRFLFVPLCLAATAFAAAQDQPTPIRKKLTAEQFAAELPTIERKIEKRLKELRVPGAAVAIVKDDKVVLMRGFGLRDFDKKLPVDPDTIFMIASCTKAFVSASVALAQEQGLASLDDHPRKYLPYFRLQDPVADRQMTVADLMAHTSGTSRIDHPWVSQTLTAQEAIEAVGSASPTFAFRENSQYSNILVHAGAEVAAAAFKKPWEEVLKEKFWTPLGMSRTTLAPLPKVDPKNLALGYWLNPQNQIRREVVLDTSIVPGAGSIKSSVRDLSKWLRMHLNGGLVDGKRVISKESLEATYKPRIAANDFVSYGLGWTNNSFLGTREIRHNGYLDGYQTQIGFFPEERLGYIVLSNNGGQNADSNIASIIISSLVGKADDKWISRYGKEAGVYVDPYGSEILRIKSSGLALWAIPGTGKAIRLARTGPRTYRTADPRNPQYQIEFKGDGKPSAVVGLHGRSEEFRQDIALHSFNEFGEVMDLIVREQGGRKALLKSRNIQARATNHYPNEGVWATGLMLWSGLDEYGFLERVHYGDKLLYDNHMGVGRHSGGEAADFGRVTPILGWGLKHIRMSYNLSQAVDWRKQFTNAKVIGITKYRGENCLVLSKRVRGSNMLIIEYVSQRTWQVLRREEGLAPVVFEFDDYREVDGIRIPHRIVRTDDAFRKQDMRLTEVKVVDRYPHWAYNVLEFKKK